MKRFLKLLSLITIIATVFSQTAFAEINSSIGTQQYLKKVGTNSINPTKTTYELGDAGTGRWAKGYFTDIDVSGVFVFGGAMGSDLDMATYNIINGKQFKMSLGQAITATDYVVARDADATNQLHFNVPTGASFEWSINDVMRSSIDSSGNFILSGGTATGQSNIQFKSAASNAYDTNLLHISSTTMTMGMIAGSIPTYTAANGPFIGLRGNTYSAVINQRGNLFFGAGQPEAPIAGEGEIRFTTGADVQRLIINKAGLIYIPTPSSNRFVVGGTATLGGAGGSMATIIGNTAGVGVLAIQNTAAANAGYAQVDLYNSSGTNVAGFGYGNTATIAATQDRTYFYTVAKDFHISTDSNVTRNFAVAATNGRSTFTNTVIGGTFGVSAQITGSGAVSSVLAAGKFSLLAGYTGAAGSYGLYAQNQSAGTATDEFSNVQAASYGEYVATTTGTVVGQAGYASGGNKSYGSFDRAIITKAGSVNIGTGGFASNGANTEVGGFFGLMNTAPTYTSAALIADNGATTNPIFLARDNGTTAFSVIDGGDARFGGNVALATTKNFRLYNTADETTNTERLAMDWSSNIARIYTIPSGTGSARTLQLSAFNASAGGGSIQLGSVAQFVNLTHSNTTLAGNLTGYTGVSTNSSGTSNNFVIIPTVSGQSGTAGYNALYINPAAGGGGSGTKNLIYAALNSVERFSISEGGVANFATGAVAGGVGGFTYTPGAHTAVTAEINDFKVAAHTMTITGSYTSQTFSTFNRPTISAATPLVVDNATNVLIEMPQVASSAVITQGSALGLGSAVTGALINNSATTSQALLYTLPQTFTLGTPVQITSTNGIAAANLQQITVNQSGGAVIVDNASTLFVAGPPIPGAGVTITNNDTFRVASGTSRFGGNLLFTGQATDFLLKDNTTAALAIKEGANSYLAFNTNDGQEYLSILKTIILSASIEEKQGADIASASTISLGMDGNSFELTGTTTVNLISNLGKQDGSTVTLICNENVTINSGTATSGTDITISLDGGGNFNCTAKDNLTLKLQSTTAAGQYWGEVSRSVL